eukprot:XP_011683302.1 PREDICTED: uncharacterized protein LOC754005 [Strongylocentrotus purpuratus]
MPCSVTPGPLGWSYLSSVALALLIVSVHLSSANACCVEERGPTTNCSFSHGQDSFLCDITEVGYSIDTCRDEGIAPLGDTPGPIRDASFHIEPYFTSCSPFNEHKYKTPLNVSSCHTPCSHGNRVVHAGLNITFKADPWTSEHLRAITISLRRGSRVYVHCVTLRLNDYGPTQAALAEHEFHYDGFIGLEPGEEYTVSILTLPTNTNRQNWIIKPIRIPWESCWVPDLKIHETPFAVNLTLFQDLRHGFKRFYVHLYNDPYNPLTREVDFRNADLYEMDGKNGTNILFECIEPTATELNLYVEAVDCRFCLWDRTKIQVKGVPPKFVNCPEHDIIQEVEITKPMRYTTPVSWTSPTPIFQSTGCGSGRNRSHDPNSVFQVGMTTPIRYLAWQYTYMAECTFNVQVLAVDTTPPQIVFCPDNITAYAKPKMKTLEVSWREPMFDDASNTTMTIVTPYMPDSQTSYNFHVWVNTTVKYQIMDAYNNMAYCSFSVYVKGDTDPPRITYCPRSIDVKGQPKMKSAEIQWERPQFNDASDTIVTIVTPDMPDNETSFQFSVGMNTTVKYKITDAYNNSAYCSFFVYIKETPSASPLVIALSCLAGLLLILLLVVLICKKMIFREPEGSMENLPVFSAVNIDAGVPLKYLDDYVHSQCSIDKSCKNLHDTPGHPERTISLPNIQEQSSGYSSNEEFAPSMGHRPNNVEEETESLVWKEEERSFCGSQYSGSSDDSPVSLESTC